MSSNSNAPPPEGEQPYTPATTPAARPRGPALDDLLRRIFDAEEKLEKAQAERDSLKDFTAALTADLEKEHKARVALELERDAGKFKVKESATTQKSEATKAPPLAVVDLKELVKLLKESPKERDAARAPPAVDKVVQDLIRPRSIPKLTLGRPSANEVGPARFRIEASRLFKEVGPESVYKVSVKDFIQLHLPRYFPEEVRIWHEEVTKNADLVSDIDMYLRAFAERFVSLHAPEESLKRLFEFRQGSHSIKAHNRTFRRLLEDYNSYQSSPMTPQSELNFYKCSLGEHCHRQARAYEVQMRDLNGPALTTDRLMTYLEALPEDSSKPKDESRQSNRRSTGRVNAVASGNKSSQSRGSPKFDPKKLTEVELARMRAGECFECGSKDHMRRNCPKRQQKDVKVVAVVAASEGKAKGQ